VACRADEDGRVTADCTPLRPGGFEITGRGLDFCTFSGESRILDAGCGTGSTLNYLLNRHPAGVFGVDMSASLLGKARSECGNVPLVQARLESLPFRSGVFDGIVCECVLSLTGPEQSLNEFGRLIRDGGYLLLSDLYRKGSHGGKEEERGGAGLLQKDHIMGLLDALGFRTIIWEDRTDDLKKFAAQLVLTGGMGGGTFLDCIAPSLAPSGGWSDVGYYLAVAEKTGRMKEKRE